MLCRELKGIIKEYTDYEVVNNTTIEIDNTRVEYIKNKRVYNVSILDIEDNNYICCTTREVLDIIESY